MHIDHVGCILQLLTVGAAAALEQCFQALGVSVQFIKVHHEADGSFFPNSIPNRILPENRAASFDVVKARQDDMGIAWDGGFDRCFLLDENGECTEGYYIVGQLAEAFLKKEPGARIIHDPRLTKNTIDICERHGYQTIQSKTGHTFIKKRLRKENTIYCGEISA